MAMSRISEIADEFEKLTADGIIEWLGQHSKQVTTGAPKLGTNFCPGAVAPVFIVGGMNMTGGWTFQVSTDMVIICGMFYIIQEAVAGLSSDQISAITYRDFEPVTRHLNIGHQRTFQAMLNRVNVIINA